MIVTEFYEGQGLGNQLWCYVTTRSIALDRNYEFGIQCPENFKGSSFMNLNFGTVPKGIIHNYEEKRTLHPLNGSEIRLFDTDLIHVQDNTKIDGLMQDEQYIIHHKEEIRQWLKVYPEYECYTYSSDEICIINFRGSGYVNDRDFFLRPKYWQDAIANMKKINQNFKFVVITEDVRNAKKFFPNFDVFHFNIATDYAIIKNAKYLILSNSSFAWFPAWLNENLKYCIAPKYWARHNISDGYWSLGYNITTGWMYQDRDGNLQEYDSCLKELNTYTQKHPELFLNRKSFNPSLFKQVKNAYAVFSTYRNEMSLGEATKSITELVSSKIYIFLKGKTWSMYMRIKKSNLVLLIKKPLKKVRVRIERATREKSWNASMKISKKTWTSTHALIEYRKKIKIYDVFTFFNELDLLEIRLNILDQHVDYFVIVEADKTFSGTPRQLCYPEHKARFKKWEHKIIYHPVQDVPVDEKDLLGRLLHPEGLNDLDIEIIQNTLSSDTVGKNALGISISTWLREFYVKESIKKALTRLSDTDICYISDLDEIWNPYLVIDYTKDTIFKLRQLGYIYYLNNRTNEDEWHGWLGTIVTKYKNIQGTCLNHLRTHRKMDSRYVFLPNGGWHFSFQGGIEGAEKKLKDYNHFWYNPEENLPNIRQRVKDNEDFRGRDIRIWKDERDLPEYLKEHKKQYEHLFKQ